MYNFETQEIILKMAKLNKLNTTKLILLTVTYLFISTAFIFYLPPQTLLYAATGNSAVVVSAKINHQHHGQPESAQIRRPDKSTLEERKNVTINPLALAALTAILIWVACIAFASMPKVCLPQNYLLNNRQYSYLTLCTFRI